MEIHKIKAGYTEMLDILIWGLDTMATDVLEVHKREYRILKTQNSVTAE